MSKIKYITLITLITPTGVYVRSVCFCITFLEKQTDSVFLYKFKLHLSKCNSVI